MEAIFVFALGTLLGSFLNVCIYRLPRGQSIIHPPSHCSSCSASIPFYQNVPILSYIALRGRCSKCSARIPLSYPGIESLTGVLLLMLWWHFGLGSEFILYSLLILFLVPITFIDIDFQLILNKLTFPGMVVGLVATPLLNELTWAQSILGLLLGGLFLWGIATVGSVFFKQEAMGAGDIKLGAMIGSFLGPSVVVALFLSFFLALPVIALGLLTKRLRIGSRVPFGPFICTAAVIVICYGQWLYYHYISFLS